MSDEGKSEEKNDKYHILNKIPVLFTGDSPKPRLHQPTVEERRCYDIKARTVQLYKGT